MITHVKDWLKRRWPPLHLRTILFATLFFVAALPGAGAVFLRVYENTLVRQTEAELIAQGAALAATAAALWPGAPPLATTRTEFTPEPPGIDLNATPILPERPPPRPAPAPPDPATLAAGARLDPILDRTRQTTLAAIVLLDGRGRVVSGVERGYGYAHVPEVRAALRGQSATALRRNAAYRQVYAFEWLSRAAAIRVHHARPVIVGGETVGVILLSRSARALFRGLYEDRGKIAVGIAAIFALLVLLSGILSRGIARPIETLGAATRSVASGRGRVPDPPPTAAIEIQGLYRDFAVMAQAIEHRSRYLRDFAHAVSHEFKTPLAGIRGAIELLQDHDAGMSPHERRRFLTNADADAGRLSALVTRLLELARADMTRSEGGVATGLAPVLARVADAMRNEAFAVTVDSASALPSVAVPAATLESALAALIENSRQAGATMVTVQPEQSDGAIRLRLTDNGPGIPPADRARIFEPFFTTRRAAGGTGLGLPIIRSLLEAAGATIELAETRQGAAFALTLPISL